ncbi:hypothetical protein MA9V1_119 [Chryseobacterium phage MA9V-1]|nr:hypothetical protein MA9V1_119 [Chryseobacterium phage MA9V-1]
MQTFLQTINESGAVDYRVKNDGDTVTLTMYIGQVNVGRFIAKIEDDKAVITYMRVGEYYRHNGYGTVLLKKLIRILKTNFESINEIYVTIKKSQSVSTDMFRALLSKAWFEPRTYGTVEATFSLKV